MSSVNEAFSLLSAFQKASGLKFNLSKTQGLYCNRSMPPSSSTNIAWTNQCYTCTSCHNWYGTQNITSEWEQILNKYKTTTVQLSSLPATYNAKSLLSKTKLLPTISCTACIYPVSTSSAVARVSEPPPEISRGAPHTLLAYYYELQ